MAERKWVPGLASDTPVADAARIALKARLDSVAKWLPLAADSPEADIEYVHQLRVSTRRARAALGLFGEWLPKDEARELKKDLKTLRSAAGEARDWDVFALDLEERRTQLTPLELPAMDFLLGFAHGERAEAQLKLVKATHGKRFESRWRRLIRSIVPSNETLKDLVPKALWPEFDQFELLLRGDLSQVDELHQVRLQGKRLRYLMELFVECFDEPFRQELYLSVSELQEILGGANDRHVAVKRLGKIGKALKKSNSSEWRRVHTGLDALISWNQSRLKDEQATFHEWLQSWRQSTNRRQLILSR